MDGLTHRVGVKQPASAPDYTSSFSVPSFSVIPSFAKNWLWGKRRRLLSWNRSKAFQAGILLAFLGTLSWCILSPATPHEESRLGPPISASYVESLRQAMGWVPANHWSRLPHKRLLVTQFASASHAAQFRSTWENHESKFMKVQQDASLLLACPAADKSRLLQEVIERQKWQYVGSWEHDHPFAHGPLLQYRTPKEGIEVFFQPMNLHFPKYYNESHPKPIPTCAGGRPFSWQYALYSGAVFAYQLIHLPFLARYDYFMKIDGDLSFGRTFPFDLGADMAARKCIVAHSAIHGSVDCEDQNLAALLAADKALGWPEPKSLAYSWCNKNGEGRKGDLMFFGNFQAYKTQGFLLSPQILSISRYMYEEWKDGYYKHRWGDQGPFVMYACQMLDVPDLSDDARICSYANFREDGLLNH